MNLAVLLREANVPPNVIDSLLRLGLTTPEVCYTFLVNNPLMTRPDIATILGVEGWLFPGGEAGAAGIRKEIIRVLEASGTLAPNYLNLRNRQSARENDAPLSVPLEAGLIQRQPDEPPREVKALDIVSEVDQKAVQAEMVDRDLPVAGLDLRMRPSPIIPWPVRDQRPTPSCMAFSIAAALELHLARQTPIPPPGKRHPAPPRLSARFLFREARKLVLGNPVKLASPAYKGGGLKQEDVAAVLAAQGVPLEALYRDKFEKADWAATLVDFNNLNEPQSALAKADALADALTRKHAMQIEDFPDYRKRVPGMARKVFDHLQQGRPVVVSIPGFSEPKDPNVKGSGESVIWHDEHFWETGILPLPPPHYIVGKPGHAVCVMGYLPMTHLPKVTFPNYTNLSGYFMFRNSWGAQYFARNSPIMDPALNVDFDFPRGYGLIPATLMEYFVWEYGVIQ